MQVLAALWVPEPNGCIHPSASEQTPIWTKGQTEEGSGLQTCPEQGTTGASPVATCLYLPQRNSPISPAQAGQGFAVRRKSQIPGRTRLPTGQVPQDQGGGSRLRLRPLPQAQLSIKTTAGQKSPIRTPGDCKHLIRMLQTLHIRATLGVPEPNGRAQPSACEQAPIRGKG